jgi:arginyl-tRNA synthetase
LYHEIQQKVRQRFVEAVREVFGVETDEPVLGYPPSVEMGELSITSCFELAKRLRQPPRKIADQLWSHLLPIEGVERVSVAGAGYINLHLDRARLAEALFALRTSARAERERSRGAPLPGGGKMLVEHTSINPNKAAHIGHLRNAVLGDTFVRLLRFRGRDVEVQNYIDNTGVQVADVVVGFVHLERKNAEDVRKLIDDAALRFDYYCWDLYARVFRLYEADQQALALRAEALKAIEEGHGQWAAIAGLVSTAVVRKHLETMWRVNVRYDLLVQESEILRLDFWKSAFELMKKTGAIRYEESGKNRGCWVMSLGEAGERETQPARDGGGAARPEPGESDSPGLAEEIEDVKIIVRSNGTVTYVGKDIAYHLWKFGLLGKDFGYETFYTYPDGHRVWRTTSEGAGLGNSDAPAFGKASVAYAVIDTRQSYVQNVVRAAFHALGYHQQASHLRHFAYEVVGLSPACAEEMGVERGEEERQRSYVEVSGRKGLGIKADDLIDKLVTKATEEVASRDMTESPAERHAHAQMIAVAALRYFLLKFTRRSIIAFDFKEALAFEGETGPYLQYSVVRARNIFRKLQEAQPDWSVSALARVSPQELKAFFGGEDGSAFWEMTLLATQLETSADQAIEAQEPAVFAKYAFRLAQAFSNFYHHHRILSEPDAARQRFLLYLVSIVNETLCRALDLLGIEIPGRM